MSEPCEKCNESYKVYKHDDGMCPFCNHKPTFMIMDDLKTAIEVVKHYGQEALDRLKELQEEIDRIPKEVKTHE